MILSVNQPYFAPYSGFFYKIHRSDIFVLLDDVQLPRGTTWITRNRFKNDQGTLWLTVPVWKKGLGLQVIRDVRICRKGRRLEKMLESLRHGYRNAPYYREHIDFLASVFYHHDESLVELNAAIIQYIVTYLGIDTKIFRQSDIGVKGRGMALLVDLCRHLAADVFLAQSPAKKYLDESTLKAAGLKISYIRPPSIVYPQLWGDFIADLSTFDLLMTCGPKSRDLLLGP